MPKNKGEQGVASQLYYMLVPAHSHGVLYVAHCPAVAESSAVAAVSFLLAVRQQEREERIGEAIVIEASAGRVGSRLACMSREAQRQQQRNRPGCRGGTPAVCSGVSSQQPDGAVLLYNLWSQQPC